MGDEKGMRGGMSKRLKALIRKEFTNLKDDFVALLIVDAEKFAETNIELVRILKHENKLPGVYITGNVPYKNLKDHFDSHKVDLKDLTFIDMVTQMSGEEAQKEENCVFVDSPDSLTELSVTLDRAMDKIKGREKFLILDSVSTLLIYNKDRAVEKFTHFLANNLRETPGTKGILLAVQTNENKNALEMLAQFCDKVVKLV
ncbi:MAG: hypothetical protein HYW05_04595 [Candidatus Diapherotrites archaeon]|nr:hypothetical protein [Candidatus Diapherotrites archaeon]